MILDLPISVTAKSNRKVEEPIKEDIQVTPSMQNYVAKKLSNLIENKVQFVEIEAAETEQQLTLPEDNDYDGIRLFSNSITPLCSLLSTDEPQPGSQTKKPTRKRKSRVRDTSPDETIKISESVIDPAYILDQVEVRGWHHNETRLNKRVDCYNLRNGQLYPVEPCNEFSKLKKKNNWEYKKIQQAVHQKKSE